MKSSNFTTWWCPSSHPPEPTCGPRYAGHGEDGSTALGQPARRIIATPGDSCTHDVAGDKCLTPGSAQRRGSAQLAHLTRGYATHRVRYLRDMPPIGKPDGHPPKTLGGS